MSPAFCLDEDQYIVFNQFKHTPIDSFNQLIIRKLNMLVIANMKNFWGRYFLEVG